MSTRKQLHENFLEEYERLNSQQRAAVDRIEGPVMVIAGPGTGKTQILGARVGKILLETDVSPQNILCLTYTDAGVIAMRRRLLSFIGPDAYRVGIFTFHAFCHEVIQDNLSVFEKTELDPISELERITLFRELIDNFPKGHPLKRYRGDVYFEINNLSKLFHTMKKEGWTPEFISSKIDEYIKELPEREEFIYKTDRAGKWKKGDLKPAYHEELERMEKLRAAVKEFPIFQEMMRSRRRYDFDDMINWVIKAFEENAGLLARYQEQYQYILVDEYQDTSGTQNRLVELLISFWDKPNVFVVGDDDQSIYRFQGANVENMEHFRSNYSADLFTVILKDNYRSTQPILDFSKSLINRNRERLINRMEGLTKDLISSNEKLQELKYIPIVRQYNTQREEMTGITFEIEKLINDGVPPSRIAVLYKENKYGDELAGYFRVRNIPVYTKKDLNLFELPLTRKLILVLKYLAAEMEIPFAGDEMLFEILHFDWFAIPPVEIARMSIAVDERRYTDNKTSLRSLLQEKINTPVKDLFSTSPPEGMISAGKFFEDMIASVPNLTLQSLVEKMIRESGLLKVIMEGGESIWEIHVLTALFDFIKEETRRNPAMSLKELVEVISLMEKEKIPIPLSRVSGSDKGVNLLTAHGAKGLEFLHVFIAGCNSIVWEKKRKPGGGFKLPDNIFSSQATGDADEELRRLFYVALTRAEQHLHLSYCCYRHDGRELEPTMFLAELLDGSGLSAEKITIDEKLLAEFQLQQFAGAPEIGKLDEELVTALVDRFVMNVTALNNYLNCPLEFYFRNLVRIPSPRNEATEFGSAVHHALEQLFRKMQTKEQFPPLKEFITDFEWYMQRHRESFTLPQYKRRMEYGQEILKSYYERYVDSWNKIVAVERNIRNVAVKGVPLKGKLDKLEFNGREVNVVDYKTGDPEKAESKLKPPNEKLPLGGDYWRQAVFYKILLDHYEQRKWQVVSTEFDFIEPDKKGSYRKRRLIISPEDVTAVTAQITETWEKIRNHEFYTGCGKDDCHWCNFVKTNKLAVAYQDVNEEDSVV